jgi:hypothetical protein
MKEPIEFTDGERFLISYYRDQQLSNWARHVVHDGLYIVLSIAGVALYLTQQDVAWGFVGYGIILWRVCWGVWGTRRYMKDYRSILMKYDAKLRELAEEPNTT